MKYLYLSLALVLISGCSQTTSQTASHKKLPKAEYIKGLSGISQDVSEYAHAINKGYISSLEKFATMYFQPWNIDSMDIPLENAMWAYKLFDATNSYGENLQPLDDSFFKQIKNNSNFEAYSSVNKQAITLRKVSIRAFPTTRPVLRDPNKAGEGFPFDYMQNSTVAANKPLFVSHYSKDREWVFVKSSFAYGWVHARDIVYMDRKCAEMWQKAQQVFVLQDNVPLYTPKKDFLFKSTLGTMFPIISQNQKEFHILTIAAYMLKEPYCVNTSVNRKIGHKGILKFNAKNINLVMGELLHVNYGWGGIYNQRDCSSTLRDFFAPFGIWLPRNSYQQSRVGKVISLENISDEKKIKMIQRYGVPFETLLYRKGHIALYVGTKNNKIVVFQNLWGIKTLRHGVEGRYIIGKTVFSTLQLGSNLSDFDESASFLKNLKSMNIVTR
ncbi:SH3 domain-containing protein [Sulfurimonas sp. NWX367]|uniref:SH3 domain-containing protein n=1 Tax=Sulfurimonas sp. NWX367 TaxID=2925413 RepID=UPI003204E04D